jgi:hypothetical protein
MKDETINEFSKDIYCGRKESHHSKIKKTFTMKPHTGGIRPKPGAYEKEHTNSQLGRLRCPACNHQSGYHLLGSTDPFDGWFIRGPIEEHVQQWHGE